MEIGAALGFFVALRMTPQKNRSKNKSNSKNESNDRVNYPAQPKEG
jgi:hypothetical protein